MNLSPRALFQQVHWELAQVAHELASAGRIRTPDREVFDAALGRIEHRDSLFGERATVHGADGSFLGEFLVAQRAEYVAAERKLPRESRQNAADDADEIAGNYVDKLQRAPV